MKWNATRSLALSKLLVCCAFAGIAAAVFFIPAVVRAYDTARGGASVFWPLCVTCYLTLVPGTALAVNLHKLLHNISAEQVFVTENCEHLRVISWCCFAVALLFFVFGFWRIFSFLIAIAAAFFGVILRVLKNVFEQAVLLREENDGTI